MRHVFGWVVAGGILLGLATPAKAQVAISIGSPFGGYSSYYGTGYSGGLGPYGGYGMYAPTYGSSYYSSAYSGYVAPGTALIQQSYGGLYPSYASSYYSGLGYGPYGYGSSYYGGAYPYMGGYGFGIRRGFGIGGFRYPF